MLNEQNIIMKRICFHIMTQQKLLQNVLKKHILEFLYHITMHNKIYLELVSAMLFSSTTWYCCSTTGIIDELHLRPSQVRNVLSSILYISSNPPPPLPSSPVRCLTTSKQSCAISQPTAQLSRYHFRIFISNQPARSRLIM